MSIFIWDTEIQWIYTWDTLAKEVYIWDVKVRPNEPVYEWEMIAYKMNADSSWNLYVPTAWYGTWGSMNCSYNWKVLVDNKWERTFSWTWSWGSKITLSWYTSWSSHIITIKPVSESYWWARAFWWTNTSCKTYLTEVIYDWSYKWYATSATNTWNYFRWHQFDWCSNLVYVPDEVLPNTVTTLWNYFRIQQFQDCSNLLEAPAEAFSSSISTLAMSFRTSQYARCTKLNSHRWYICINLDRPNYYRENQFQSCNANKVIKVLNNVSNYSEQLWSTSYITQVKVPSAYLTNYRNSSYSPRANIADNKFVWY